MYVYTSLHVPNFALTVIFLDSRCNSIIRTYVCMYVYIYYYFLLNTDDIKYTIKTYQDFKFMYIFMYVYTYA